MARVFFVFFFAMLSTGFAPSLSLVSPIDGKKLPVGTIALTFDDGPVLQCNSQGRDCWWSILNIAEELRKPEYRNNLNPDGIPITHFAVGCNFLGEPQVSPPTPTCPLNTNGWAPTWVLEKLVYGYGGEVGYHTYSHRNLTLLSDQEILNEVRKGMKYVSYLQDPSRRYFRFPGFGQNQHVIDVINSQPDLQGLVGPVNADVLGVGVTPEGVHVTGDWDCSADYQPVSISPASCFEAYKQDVEARLKEMDPESPHGLVILLHDKPAYESSLKRVGYVNNYTLELTKLIVKYLQSKGHKFVLLPSVGGPRLCQPDTRIHRLPWPDCSEQR